MKKIITIFCLLVSSLIYSQNNITNTLGTGGAFTIKDGSTTFFTLSQSDGHITLPETRSPSTLGVIFKGAKKFIHDFNPTGAPGYNTFLGSNAGNFTMSYVGNKDASYNTGVGAGALLSLTTGFENTALGYSSLVSNTTGSLNTALGTNSLISNTTGFENTATGYGSLYSNTTGAYNTASGSQSLYYNTTGSANTAIGYLPLALNTTGNYNTALGYKSLSGNTVGHDNTGIGVGSLELNDSGNENTAVGSNSLRNNSTGLENTALGYNSLFFNNGGSFNTALGSHSLDQNSEGSSNTALGRQSLFSNTTGNLNTGIGVLSLSQNTTGNENTATGSKALLLNTTGNFNTATGYNSLFFNTTGFQNTAIGHHSLQNNNGNYNTALGYNAGSTVTTGYNLTLLGIDANPSSPTAHDQITLGNTFVTSLRCAATTITSLSDARDKKNIKALNLGIDFLMKIKPRIYNWDKREWYADNKSDGSKMEEKPTAGFIAQELDEVQTTENAEWLNLVLKDNPEKLEATPGNLLPVIVKAIQDLKEENDKLKMTNTELTVRLNKFEQMQNTLMTEIERLKTNSNKTTEVSLGKK